MSGASLGAASATSVRTEPTLPRSRFERSRFAADACACPKRATWKIRDYLIFPST
jgi:hypothetical protein